MSDIHCESLQLANHRENVPEWGGIFHLHDRRFHLMSRDGGNIVLSHPRVEFFHHFHLQCAWESVVQENLAVWRLGRILGHYIAQFYANSRMFYCILQWKLIRQQKAIETVYQVTRRMLVFHETTAQCSLWALTVKCKTGKRGSR